MSRSPIVLVSVFVLAAFAGCAEGVEEMPTSSTTVEFDAETGAVEGLVLSGEELPIPAAQVAIPDADRSAVTDAQGRFVLNQIPPGTYTLFAQALGYASGVQRVEVVAGQATRTSVVLEVLAIQEPYVTQVIQDGLFGCGASWWPPEPVLGIFGIAACGVFGNAPVVGEYDEFLLNWEIERDIVGWNGSVFEMSWESNQVLGRGLTMRWEVCANNAATRFSHEEGVSPLRTYASAEHVHRIIHNGTYNDAACNAASNNCNDDHCAFISRVFSTAQTTGMDVDIGVTFQQRYTQYHTAFFYEAGALDYTAIVDG